MIKIYPQINVEKLFYLRVSFLVFTSIYLVLYEHLSYKVRASILLCGSKRLIIKTLRDRYWFFLLEAFIRSIIKVLWKCGKVKNTFPHYRQDIFILINNILIDFKPKSLKRKNIKIIEKEIEHSQIFRAGYGFCAHRHKNPKTFQVLPCKDKGIFPSLTIPKKRKPKDKNLKTKAQIILYHQFRLIKKWIISKKDNEKN